MTRILTGGVLAVLVTAVTLASTTTVVALAFGALWLAGGWEWSRLAQLGRLGSAVFLVSLIGAMFACLHIGSWSFPALVVLALVAVPLAFAVAGMVRFPQGFAPGVDACIGLLSLVPSWFALVQIHAAEAGLALAAIVVVWGADVGAYAVGRTWGRLRLAPKISPGKTWEGAAGGIGAALVVGAIAGRVLGLGAAIVVVAALGAVASVLGDLAVSMLKRIAGLKDSGSLLPGHGGVLDRIDGLTTGLPVLALGLQFCSLLD